MMEFLARTAVGLLAPLVLTSCGLRLPVETQTATVTVAARSRSHPEAEPPRRDVLVWLISDNFHTGIVASTDWLVSSGFVPPPGLREARYLTMSWGNSDAYSPAGIDSPGKWMRVLFTPTPSVTEFIPFDWHVVETLPSLRVWRARVARERGADLVRFLNECNRLDEQGRPQVVRPSSWGEGVQVENRHSYFIPRVCNVWTAQAFESLGFTFRPWFALTANGLIRQAEAAPNHFETIWPGGGMPESWDAP